jgi:hypothetical protein
VRGIEDREAVDDGRMGHGHAPGHEAAPVVAHDVRAVRAGAAHQVGHVTRQHVQTVLAYAAWLVRQVVTAQIGSDDAEAGRRQQRDLMPTGVPVLGKPVQEDHERPSAGFHPMQLDAIRHPLGVPPGFDGRHGHARR